MFHWPHEIPLMHGLRLHKGSLDDLDALKKIGRETYFDTFAAMNTPENMRAYLDSAFCPDRLSAELQTPASAFYLLESGETHVGYLKLNVPPAQSDLNAADTLEIERIYVIKGHQGGGLGRGLLETAEHIARQGGCKATWLGVWEKNVKAIGFYERMGYSEVGRHSFRMGEEVQSDLIMKKTF